jgi:hypothetical protein
VGEVGVGVGVGVRRVRELVTVIGARCFLS